MLTANSMLTVLQLICGVLSNSLSLLGDGMLMGMDSICYAVAIYAETFKMDAKQAGRADRFGAMFSIVMLGLTSTWVVFDVIDRLAGDGSSDRPPLQVNSKMMIGFTLVNLVVDSLVAVATYKLGVAAPGGHSADQDGEAAVTRRPSEDAKDKGENMNLLGALAHLAADGVRGVAVLVAGSLALAGVVDPVLADAYCSLFVCLFVLAAVVSLLRMLLVKAVPVSYEQVEELAEMNVGTKDELAPNIVDPTTIGCTVESSVDPFGDDVKDRRDVRVSRSSWQPEEERERLEEVDIWS